MLYEVITAGYEKIYQICPCWRREERGKRHLSEFTLLEWYRAGCDYHSLMSDCEALIASLVPEGRLTYQGQSLQTDRNNFV